MISTNQDLAVMRKKVDTLQLVVTKNTVYMVYSSGYDPSTWMSSQFFGCPIGNNRFCRAIWRMFPGRPTRGAQEVLNILKKTRLLVREERRANVNI